MRRVCPAADTDYTLTVTDTATTGELARAAQTAKASVMAEVMSCADGGPGPSDAATLSSCSTANIMNQAASCSSSLSAQIDPVDTGPLVAGTPTGFRVTGNGNLYAGQGWHWEIWGSPDGCTLDELLGKFQLVNGPYEFDFCVTPAHSNAHLVFVYRLMAGDALSLSAFTVERCATCTGD
jgi:hypothetical protein